MARRMRTLWGTTTGKRIALVAGRSGTYDAVADLIGRVQGGDPLRSTRGPRWIATMLARRRRLG